MGQCVVWGPSTVAAGVVLQLGSLLPVSQPTTLCACVWMGAENELGGTAGQQLALALQGCVHLASLKVWGTSLAHHIHSVCQNCSSVTQLDV